LSEHVVGIELVEDSDEIGALLLLVLLLDSNGLGGTGGMSQLQGLDRDLGERHSGG
jgi:hypothetical protein